MSRRDAIVMSGRKGVFADEAARNARARGQQDEDRPGKSVSGCDTYVVRVRQMKVFCGFGDRLQAGFCLCRKEKNRCRKPV